jgi:CRISPR-associated endonuclease Csn1
MTAAGVRTFEAGVEASYDQMMQGKQKSKAANRRSKRGPRRQFWRRAWRRYKVMKCLIDNHLMSDPGERDIRKPEDQDGFIKSIDDNLRKRLRPAKGDPRRHLWEQVWLYELRASALERKLDPLELARALYHLAQRRGFLSNRKTDAPDDDDKPKKPKRAKKDKSNRTPLTVDESEQPGAASSDGDKEDPKKVKAAITKLGQDMEQAIPDPRFRTLGFYFARHVNPEERRIRQRWTGRAMYEAEFKAICDAQSAYYPGLAEKGDFRQELDDAIFFQRPLKPCGHLVGHCDLEPTRKRAIQAIPIAQRFRLLQKVNDLTVLDPGGTEYRRLTDEQRKDLLNALSTQGDMTFKQIRTLLRFIEPKINKDTKAIERVGHQFRHEAGGEEKLPGDRTAAKILARDNDAPGVAQLWHDLSDGREELVLALVNFENNEALAENLIKRFSISPDQATALSGIRLEESRCSLSRRAMEKLLPLMERGIHFKTAEKEVYGSAVERRTAVQDLLPRLLATDQKHVPLSAARPAFRRRRDLPNPAVARALAELRKVVNAIISRYKKPARIHVELAREAKKTPLRREIAWKNSRLRQDERVAAQTAIKMCNEIGISEPKRDAVDKWLLWEECGGVCPYTGQCIPVASLFGPSPQFDIEHIVPLSLSRDNSFDNLTLCDAEYNRNVKRKQIPYVVEAGNPGRWNDILERVKRFKCQKRAVRNPNRKAKNRVIIEDRPNSKADRFAWTPEQVKEFYGDEFTPRQLNDTQYASKLAGEYLGMLYGGVIDETGKRRVQVSSGAVTATLRAEWNLNGVIPSLPDSPAHKAPSDIRHDEKVRTDHRHHAIDAIVIALSSPKAVKELSDAARRVEQAELCRQDIRDSQGKRRTRYAEMNPPFGLTRDSFVQVVKSTIADINVSHRPERKLRGPMHEGTDYSEPFDDGAGGKEYRTRRALKDLKETEVGEIVDDRVRELVKKSLAGKEPKSVFASDSALPVLGHTPDGRAVFVKSVRIRVKAKPVVVRDRSGRERYVKPGSNHHMTVHARLGADGKDKEWVQGKLVSRLDAMRCKRDFDAGERRKGNKKRSGSQVAIDRSASAGIRFVFTLQPGDMLQMTRPNDRQRLFVIRSISRKRIEYVSANDARKKDAKKVEEKKNTIKGAKEWFVMTTIDYLRQYKACKVIVSPIGEIVPAND